MKSLMPSVWKSIGSADWKSLGVISLLVAILVGTLVHGVFTLQSQKSSSLVIDLAGRQRMLHQRHMQEILLAKQGLPADYQYTRQILSSSLDALLHGGVVVLTLGKDTTVNLPPAPSGLIRDKLVEQKRLSQEFITQTDFFLTVPADGPGYTSKLDELLDLNAKLYEVSNEAVRWLDTQAESNITRRIAGEAIVLLAVALLGVVWGRQVWQANRRLENEIVVRKRAEGVLRETEETYRQILDSIADMVFVKERGSRLVWANKTFRDYYGMSIEELRGLVDAPFNEPTYTERYLQDDAYVFETGKILDVPEEPVTRHDGKVSLFHTVKAPILGSGGHVVRMVGVARDITDRKQAEEALKRSEELLRNIINNTTAVIYLKDTDGRYLLINSQFEKLFNTTLERVRGKSDYDLFPKENADTFRENDLKVLNGRAPIDTEEYAPQEDGLHTYISVKFPLLDASGTPFAVGGISTDITRLKRIEDDLRRSEEKTITALRQSDALKSALLSSVSHELRTPLTAIKSMVTTLLDDKGRVIRKNREEFVEGIHQEIDYLTRLVDNLLEMSKIEAGTIEPHREWHLLEDLIENAIRRMGKALESHSLHLNIPEDLAPVFVDGVEIQQVLVNLLENAIKYSPDGSDIRLEVTGDSGLVEVRVSNLGSGIPEEDLTRVFDRFYRAKAAREQSVPGTGLGLAICKGILDSHGGRIWAESTQNGHTTVAFTLTRTPHALPIGNLERPTSQARST